jgi:hypothetical protein
MLEDFDGYAEMIATMLKWAREKEGLKFSLLAPFNETDLGYPEGPGIRGADILTATRAIVRKLDEYGLKDVKIIAIDDSTPKSDKLEAVLSDSTLVDRIVAFSTHTYGNGDLGENEPWFGGDTDYTRFARAIKRSEFRNASIWMSEYGDLDQTGSIEYEFAWRSTRRLMKTFKYGFNAALAWDAFDNFHEHDTAWATYGLLKTDTVNWTYSPKKRYYAAKQAYRFIRPGWKMVEVVPRSDPGYDVYRVWHDLFRHIRIEAFTSPDKKDLTLLIMNGIESDTEIKFALNGSASEAINMDFSHYVTSREDDCRKISSPEINGDTIVVMLPANAISTITTLK